MHFRYIIAVSLILLCCKTVPAQSGQINYHDVSTLALTGKIVGTPLPFHRFDTSLYAFSPAVKNLLTHSAGLAVHFSSNSPVIRARWKVSGSKPGANLTPIMQKGLDLYVKRNGSWQFAGVGRPNADSAINEAVVVQNLDKTEKEFLLYLPLYDGTQHLEIGVDASAGFTPLPEAFRKRILIYGSSIVQGASASRSGMAYPAQLSRETGLNFLNLGLSGNAKMEKAAADMVASIDADAYLLDCVPNSSPDQITERTANLVNTIRQKHPKAPIFVMESIIRQHGYFDSAVAVNLQKQNQNIAMEVLKLQKAGMKDLYFIKADQLLGDDHEGTTDGTHPNDLGFFRMTQGLTKTLVPILKKYSIYQQ